VLVEYFGLAGNPEYDAKTEAKMKVAAEFGVVLIALYPRDLADQSILLEKLGLPQRAADRSNT